MLEKNGVISRNASEAEYRVLPVRLAGDDLRAVEKLAASYYVVIYTHMYINPLFTPTMMSTQQVTPANPGSMPCTYPTE